MSSADRWLLRVRHLAAAHGRVLVTGLLVVAALSGAMAVATATGPSETATITERTDRTTVSLRVSHRARVRRPNPLWATGTVLREQPMYLREAAPVLTVAVRTTVPADASVTVRQRVRLVVRASHGGEPIWNSSRLLRTRRTTVDDGSAVTTARVNVSRVARGQLARVRRAMGDLASVEVLVVVRTRYDTGRYEGTLSTTLTLSVGDRSYSVSGDRRTSRTHSQLRRRTVPVGDGGVPWLPSAVGGAAFVGAVGAAVLHRREDDPGALARRLRHETYAEWVSTGRLPDGDRTVVPVASLPDLVDVAIDADRRVVHDPEAGRYAVLVDDVRYEFRPGDRTLDDGSDPLAADAGSVPADDVEDPTDDESITANDVEDHTDESITANDVEDPTGNTGGGVDSPDPTDGGVSSPDATDGGNEFEWVDDGS